jgi:hypothetical protein
MTPVFIADVEATYMSEQPLGTAAPSATPDFGAATATAPPFGEGHRGGGTDTAVTIGTAAAATTVGALTGKGGTGTVFARSGEGNKVAEI